MMLRFRDGRRWHRRDRWRRGRLGRRDLADRGAEKRRTPGVGRGEPTPGAMTRSRGQIVSHEAFVGVDFGGDSQTVVVLARVRGDLVEVMEVRGG